MKKIFPLFLTLVSIILYSQEKEKTDEILDKEYIKEVEQQPNEKPKVLHAEPLYIDLIRDLGARKGEKEWNVGFGITDKTDFDHYEGLVEYEWAPIDRLGLEIEVPFSIYSANSMGIKPNDGINGLKLAVQYTFLVNEKKAISMALGYINELEFNDFKSMKNKTITGNIYNPFFVAAKRFGNNFHTLLYTGPIIEQHFTDKSWHTHIQVNSNFHYMIPGTRNFIGVEVNKEIHKNNFDMVLRPQMRLVINDKTMLGIVTGLPINKQNERFSTFLRLIYEPH